MSKRRIALMIALMFAVPASVVALESSVAEWSADAADVVEEALAAAGEPVTAAQSQDAEAQPAETAAQPEPAVQPEPAIASVTQPRYVAANLVRGTMADEPGTAWLPSQLAYLDRLQQERSHLIARGDVFPAADPFDRMLPSQIAYLDRAEQQRIAAARSPQVAAVRAESRAVPMSGATADTQTLIAAHAEAGR